MALKKVEVHAADFVLINLANEFFPAIGRVIIPKISRGINMAYLSEEIKAKGTKQVIVRITTPDFKKGEFLDVELEYDNDFGWTPLSVLFYEGLSRDPWHSICIHYSVCRKGDAYEFVQRNGMLHFIGAPVS